MPNVGEAWYELSARDQKLADAFSKAEGKARTTGASIEKSVGTGADKGFDNTAAAATRFGGVMGKTEAATGRFGGMIKSLGAGVLQGVGIAGFFGITAAAGAFVEGLGHAVTAASDLNETVSKVGVVFGQQSSEVQQWAANSATAFGLSKNAALGAAASYGNLFVALKLPAPAAADMSTQLVELAGDLASFNNVPVDDALAALQSGLVGETEPLRRFGVNLNEATIAQKALELGLISSIKDGVTPAIKAQASYALIMDQTKTAQGDFARTSSGLANQQRISAARLEDAFAKAGQAIMPLAATIVPLLADALTAVIGGIGDVINGIAKWADENRGFVDGVGTVISVLMTLAGAVLGALFEAWSRIFGALGSIIGAWFDAVKFVIGGIIGAVRNVMDIASQIPGPWQQAASDMKTSLDGMQKSVESWGTSTRTEASNTGNAVPGAVAGPIAAGAGTVGAAAKAGITDPVAGAAAAGTAAAAAQGVKTPQEFAKGLQDARFSVKDAWEAINAVAKTTMSKQAEIASIQSFLTGDRMKAGLHSKRPEVRAEFEAWKGAAEDRLWALRKGVPDIAAKTGVSYADALAAKKAEAREAASKVAEAAKAKLEASNQAAYRYGQSVGHQYAGGMRSTLAEVTKAAAALGMPIQKYLQLQSPAEEGPLSEHGGPEGWGETLGRQYSGAILASVGLVTDAIRSFARPMATLAPGASVAAAAPVTQSRSWVGDVVIPITANLPSGDPVDIRRVGRQLGEEVRLSLVRGPGLFAMDGR